jgi:4-oxalocrotonate tautomerase
MPLVEIKVFAGEFTADERRRIIESVTDTMVRFTGESIRPHTWVLISEVPDGSWGVGGAALGLPDVRSLQASKGTAG